MEGEDWPDPLPEGWVLKKFSDMVWAHNEATGQTFRTKKDLLRYVQYVKYVLPLLSKNDCSSKDLVDVSSPKGVKKDSSSKELVAAPSSKGVEKDSSSKEWVAVSSSQSKAADDAGGSNDDADAVDGSLYGGIDFSKGIWSADVEMIEPTSFHAPVPVTDNVLNVHNNQWSNKKMKVQVDQQPETKMEPGPGLELKPKLKLKPKPKMEPGPGLELKPKLKLKPKPKLKLKPKPKPKPKTAPEPAPARETEPAPEPEPAPARETEPAPEPEPESEAEVRAEVRAGAGAEEEAEAEAGVEQKLKTKMDSEQGGSKRRGGRRKKFELPPKRFRGFK